MSESNNRRVQKSVNDTQKSGERLTPQKPKPALNFLLLSAGSMFTSMIVAGFLVGYVFDQLLDTTPLFLLGCGVLGFIGGILKVHKLLGKMDLIDLPTKEQESTSTLTNSSDQTDKKE